MNICLFTPEEISKPLDLRDERAQHIIKILHKKEGDSFSAGIINSAAGKATITKIDIHTECSADKRKTFDAGSISFTFEPLTDGKPLYPLTMIIGFPRPIQLKRLLRDMAGLGVCSIHLCVTELGEKSYLKSDLATGNSTYQMLYEGTEQAASTHVPQIFMHSSLKECLEQVEKENCQHSRLALDNINAKTSLGSFITQNPLYDSNINKPLNTVAAIGSERGWTNTERTLLEQFGYTRLSMGQRVLRTETASTVAASLILNSMQVLN